MQQTSKMNQQVDQASGSEDNNVVISGNSIINSNNSTVSSSKVDSTTTTTRIPPDQVVENDKSTTEKQCNGSGGGVGADDAEDAANVVPVDNGDVVDEEVVVVEEEDSSSNTTPFNQNKDPSDALMSPMNMARNGDANNGDHYQHQLHHPHQHHSNDNYTDGAIDDIYYNKLPHWSQNVATCESIPINDCQISGGSDVGQLPYFTETGDIILEIDGVQVAGLTSADINSIISRNLVHHFKLVTGTHGLPLELREYLSRRFSRGSVDHKLQELIRENIYSRTVPCTTRPPRYGEVDGGDYRFLSKEQFFEMERAGLLLESGVYCNHYYGTPLPSIKSSNSTTTTPIHSTDATLNSTTGSSTGCNGSSLSITAKRRRNRSNIVAIDAASLPYGWERISDAHYGVYYIDHINKRTQYERPYEIELVKALSGFGFTLVEIDKGLVIVKSLIVGGAAEASGVIQSGDILVSVAGVSVSGLQHSDVAHLFTNFNVGDRVRLTFARGYQLPIGFSDEDYDIITLKIVKGAQGFGFTISEGHNGQKVKKILDTERCCSLKQGDILLSINGIDLTTLTHLDVVETLKQCQIDQPTEFMIKRKKRFRSKTPIQSASESTMDMTLVRNCKTPGAEMFYTNKNLIGDVMSNLDINGNGYAKPPEYANSQLASQCDVINNNNLYINQAECQYQPPAMIKNQQPQQYGTVIPKSTNVESNETMFSNNFDVDYEYHQVSLSRTETGFGFRIIGGSEEGSNVAIGSIVVGGAAYIDGVLKAGDEIMSINDTNVLGASHQDVVQSMSQTGATVQIVVRRKRYLNAYDVTLYRQDYEGFGFVIISCGNCALIGRIIEGSPAHRCQRLHIRDRIIAVNGVDVTNMSHPEIVNKIKESGKNLHLQIIPADCYTVELVRGPNGYGFSIRGGMEFNGMPLFILCIAPNRPAASQLQVGDEILEINDVSTVGMTHSEAVCLISQGGPSVKLRLRHNYGNNDFLNNFPSNSSIPSPQLEPQSPLITANHLMGPNVTYSQSSPNLTKFVPNIMNY